VRPLIVRVFYVPTPSIVPAPKVGEWMLANEFIYTFAEPVREDHRI
jgi:signal peptidase I